MSELTGTDWPPLATAYTDEFGHIEPDVYAAGGVLWKSKAARFALSTLGDAPTGLRLMLKATAIISRKRAEPENPITDLSAYLYVTYKRLVLAEMEKENGHRQREREQQIEIESLSVSSVEVVELKILIQQLMKRMDDWMRGVFKLRVLGYSFEEIGELRGQKANALRSKYDKQLKRLKKEIQSDSETP